MSFWFWKVLQVAKRVGMVQSGKHQWFIIQDAYPRKKCAGKFQNEWLTKIGGIVMPRTVGGNSTRDVCARVFTRSESCIRCHWRFEIQAAQDEIKKLPERGDCGGFIQAVVERWRRCQLNESRAVLRNWQRRCSPTAASSVSSINGLRRRSGWWRRVGTAAATTAVVNLVHVEDVCS